MLVNDATCKSRPPVGAQAIDSPSEALGKRVRIEGTIGIVGFIEVQGSLPLPGHCGLQETAASTRSSLNGFGS